MSIASASILKILTESTVSISDLTRAGAKDIFSSLIKDKEKIILKNNKPIGAILSLERYQELISMEEDYILYLEAIKRLEANNSPTISIHSVLEKYNITKEELDSIEDVETK